MSNGINLAIILGNVGNDPEVVKANSGATITILSVATSEQWKDKNTGQDQKRTEWHRVKFFGKLADVVAQYVKKGSKLYIEGKINTEEYEKNGEKRYSTCIIGSKVEFLDSKPASSGNQSTGQPAQNHPTPDHDAFDDDIDF